MHALIAGIIAGCALLFFTPVTLTHTGIEYNVAFAIVPTLSDLGNAVLGGIMSGVNFFLAGVVALTGGLAFLAAWGFDQALTFTITDFSNSYTTYFGAGVETAWAGFRDIANILMIAMFVFIAFLVMLDAQRFQASKLAVRIVVIAVLINFSLFFTKAIIDVSNITALQFRQAIEVDGLDAGLASQFLVRSGLSQIDYFVAKGTLDDLAGSEHGGFGDVFMYTVLSVGFHAFMVAVFLFGLILLIMRIIVLLLVMVTSALAFAAYLIPDKGDKYWSMWWNNLFKYSFFAPLLLLMLWATTNITGAISTAGGSGNSASIASFMMQEDSDSWILVFTLLIVGGLFYASLKIASELSIAGANFAGSVGKGSLSFGARALGAGAVLGGIGAGLRSMLGAGAANRANNLKLQKQAVDGNLGQRLWARSNLAAAKKIASTSFDLRDTKLAKQATKATGVSLGTGVGSQTAYEKREAQFLGDAANAAAALERQRTENTEEKQPETTEREQDAATMAAGVIGQPEKMGAANDNKRPEREVTAGVTAEGIPDVAAQAPATSTEQNAQMELGEQDVSIERLKSLIERRSQERLRAEGDTAQEATGKALEGVARDLKEGTEDLARATGNLRDTAQAAQESAETAKEREKRARDEFVDRYAQGGWFRQFGQKQSRKRIVNMVKKDSGKTPEQKKTEALEAKIKALEDATKKE